MRPLAVVNPRSGAGRAGRTAGAVRAVIERSLGPVDVEVTQAPGHAIALAREAASRGCGLIIAIGGDGTIHEVANGVLEAGGGAAVGFVGQGTGGDFARTFGVEHRLDAYVGAMASGRERRIDAGRVEYLATDGTTRTRWFVNVLSAGLGGLVDRHVSQTSKALGGTAAYFWATLRALSQSRRGALRCEVRLGEGRREHRFDSTMIAICNGRYFGGGMQVAPMARPDDGRFEVVSLDAPTKLGFAMASRRIYDGKHLAAPGAQHFGCDRIAIDLENEVARDVFLLDVDGEPLGGLPVAVELVPGALNVRV